MSPPRIAIQVNDRRLITRDYAYFIENRLRDEFGLHGVPLVIDFKTSGGEGRRPVPISRVTRVYPVPFRDS